MDTSATAKKKNALYWLWLVVGLFFMFAFGHVCPTWGPVTPLGVSMIGIFIGLLIWPFAVSSG